MCPMWMTWFYMLMGAVLVTPVSPGLAVCFVMMMVLGIADLQVTLGFPISCMQNSWQFIMDWDWLGNLACQSWCVIKILKQQSSGLSNLLTEGNVCVDYLAKIEASSHEARQSFVAPPAEISNLLLANASGIFFPR